MSDNLRTKAVLKEKSGKTKNQKCQNIFLHQKLLCVVNVYFHHLVTSEIFLHEHWGLFKWKIISPIFVHTWLFVCNSFFIHCVFSLSLTLFVFFKLRTYQYVVYHSSISEDRSYSSKCMATERGTVERNVPRFFFLLDSVLLLSTGLVLTLGRMGLFWLCHPGQILLTLLLSGSPQPWQTQANETWVSSCECCSFLGSFVT